MIFTRPILSSPLRKCLIPALVLFGLLATGFTASATEALPGITSFQINSFAANLLQILKGENFVAAATYFHLDPQLTAAEKQLERADIVATLTRIYSEFGRPEFVKLLGESGKAHYFVLQGMTNEYWNQFSRFQPVSYRVNFARVGEGYLTLVIVVYDHRLQLRELSFGLPVERADSEKKLQSLLRSLQVPTE
jgi:hypothetical protein